MKEKMIEPAVEGTKNVITAAADVGSVRRVVFTSSIVDHAGATSITARTPRLTHQLTPLILSC